MKNSKLILLMVSVAGLTLLSGCGRISPGMSSANMESRNCDNIATLLEKQGFTNISTEALQRSKADYTLVNGQIDSVIIDGTEDFEADDKFKSNAPIIITYINRPDENRKERRGFDSKKNSFVNLEHYRFEVPDYVDVTDLTKNTGTCSIMNSDGSDEDACLNVFTVAFDDEVYGYNSLDENKEDWIEENFATDRDKFKLLSTKNFESEDRSVKWISFDYVYSEDGLWNEGVLTVVPNEEEMLVFELIQPDSSESLYKTDLENIATSVTEYRNTVTIADTDFVLPFDWKNNNQFTKEEMDTIRSITDLQIKDSFLLEPINSEPDSSNIVGVLLEGNDLFYPLDYNNIEDDVDSYISELYWFLNADNAYFESIGELRGIVTVIPESGNYFHFYIALTPNDDVCMLIMGDEDNDRSNNEDNQKLFLDYLSTGRAHYR
ncbi:MAG: hypothetical protein K6C99_10585 [Lachnospiraceae bacterium]|nr:hypothetical protein [Lachnospiraceae bacterium]